MTFLIGAAPLGLVSGYMVAAFTETTEMPWAWAFGAKIALLSIMTLVLQFTTTADQLDISEK